MSSIFIQLSRNDMPVKGDVTKVYQSDPTTFWAYQLQSRSYYELKAGEVEAARLMDRFGILFDSIKSEIPYHKAWSNGQGGQSNAVTSAPIIKPGVFARSMSPGNRRMIFVGTHYGNVVIYDRFGHDTTSILKNFAVYDAPKELSTIVDLCDPSGTLSRELWEDFTGVDRLNIGEYLKSIYDSIRASGRWRG